MDATAIFQPVLALALWTVVMTIWMTSTRIREIRKRSIDAQQAQDTGKLRDLLPPDVQRVAYNYNHLFEQPTLFYAIAITLAVLGHVDGLHVQCAWAFTALRVAHSLVQATVDIVLLRLALSLLSWLVLGLMIIREALILLT